MPLPLQARHLMFLFLLWATIASSAMAEESPLHWSGEKTKWNRRTNVVELTGRASVHQQGESITADHIVLDLTGRTVVATGSCRYVTADTLINSEKMEFNLDSRTGTIFGGRVSNGTYLLSGERIDRVAQTRYITRKGEYTTCVDCPSSWSLMGEEVDLEFEGYAHMKNVKVKVEGTPVVWVPYAILPMKRKRQTGLLFPRFAGTSNHGFTFVLPFFWAINRSSDMTFGAGFYGARGLRAEWEGRYALSATSGAQFNFFYTRDRNKPSIVKGTTDFSRWGVNGTQSQDFPLGIHQKLRLLEVNDNFYPIDFFTDMPGQFEPVLSSRLMFSKASPNMSSFVEFRRIRNLLEFDQPNRFDDRTVQVTPKALVTTNNQLLFDSPLAVGLTGELTNFTRTSTAFDYDSSSTPGSPFNPGVDPMRKALRLSYTPMLYTTLRPWGVLSVVPSAQYRGFFYSFDDTGAGVRIDPLNRGYLLTQLELSAQWERVYERDDADFPKVKHLIRPMLTYSRIPVFHEPDHPFLRQFGRSSGYRFDNQDVVPRTVSPSLVNYFTPLGNSLSYGVTTQVIRKRSGGGYYDSSYQRFVELTATQSIDFVQLEEDESRRVPLSRLQGNLIIQSDKITSNTNYNFIPYLSRYPGVDPERSSPHEFLTSFTYAFQSELKHGLLQFQRSVGLSYNWNSGQSQASFLGLTGTYSFSDYLMPSALFEYDFAKHAFARAGGFLVYQSPSECWRFTLGMTRYNDRRGNVFEFDFQLNLTGQGFGNL